jgi:peroxiredoxin
MPRHAPAATLALLVALPLAGGDSLVRETERQRAPDLELPDSEGQIARMADYQGKVLLLNFWATWCLPCKEEIPWFVEFERKYREQGFAVIGVNFDQSGWTKARPYMEKMGINYRVVAGDARTAYKYGGADALPVTFLIDRQRRVAAIHFGLISRKKVEEEIRKLLQDPAD